MAGDLCIRRRYGVQRNLMDTAARIGTGGRTRLSWKDWIRPQVPVPAVPGSCCHQNECRWRTCLQPVLGKAQQRGPGCPSQSVRVALLLTLPCLCFRCHSCACALTCIVACNDSRGLCCCWWENVVPPSMLRPVPVPVPVPWYLTFPQQPASLY